ncbi:MAG: hypothetical protein PUE22_05550 [Roseburia porci]|nr:hypothetical protein [Roseburia porci]
MTGHKSIFIILLILNLIIVVLYFVLCCCRKRNRFSTWMKTIVMLVCPVAGPLFLIGAYVFYRLFMSQEMDLEDVVFSKDRVQTVLHPDEDTERNMVSIEEALAVTDKDNLRNLMLNVVKGGHQNLLGSISLALDGEDSETAHYAASVLQDALNDFRVHVQKSYQECMEKNENQADHCLDLIEYMNLFLEQGVFTGMEQKSMVYQMENLGEILYEAYKQRISSDIFEMISLRLLEIPDYETCKKWCSRAMEMYPGVLASYTCELKLYFSMNDKKSFFHVMEALRQSNIVIDNETLEMIRTFM